MSDSDERERFQLPNDFYDNYETDEDTFDSPSEYVDYDDYSTPQLDKPIETRGPVDIIMDAIQEDDYSIDQLKVILKMIGYEDSTKDLVYNSAEQHAKRVHEGKERARLWAYPTSEVTILHNAIRNQMQDRVDKALRNARRAGMVFGTAKNASTFFIVSILVRMFAPSATSVVSAVAPEAVASSAVSWISMFEGLTVPVSTGLHTLVTTVTESAIAWAPVMTNAMAAIPIIMIAVSLTGGSVALYRWLSYHADPNTAKIVFKNMKNMVQSLNDMSLPPEAHPDVKEWCYQIGRWNCGTASSSGLCERRGSKRKWFRQSCKPTVFAKFLQAFHDPMHQSKKEKIMRTILDLDI